MTAVGEAHGSEWQKMVAGELYNAQDPELVALRTQARRILRKYNASAEGGSERADLLEELFGISPDGLWIEPPFYCDYGKNIRVGRNVYFNFDCVVLDVAPVWIGDHVLFGPAVQIYTATHPLDAVDRRSGLEFARPVRIESDVWIGGATVINPGVSIGAGSVIGSGSWSLGTCPNGSLPLGTRAAWSVSFARVRGRSGRTADSNMFAPRPRSKSHVDEITQPEIEAFIEGLENVQRAQAFGYTLFFVGDDHRLPFVTIADSDQEFDDVSDLDRQGVFRVNIGVSKATFGSLVGDRAAEDVDHRVLDRFLPHPHYSKQNWVCILNPGRQNAEAVKRLIAEAHAIARARTRHRIDR